MPNRDFHNQHQSISLINAIFDEGYYIRVRCPEGGDLIQRTTSSVSKANEAIGAMDFALVEAVERDIDPETRQRPTVAWFLCSNEEVNTEYWIADASYSAVTEEIERRI